MVVERSQTVHERVNRIISACKSRLASACFTTDLWTSRAMDAYISLTAAFIDESWALHRWVPNIRPFPEVSHTSDNIVVELDDMIEDIGFTESLPMYITNDNGANVVLAANKCRYCIELRCVCHTLQVRVFYIFF